MDFFKDEIVVHVLGFKKIIPYKKIIKLAWTTPVKYGGYSNYVGIIHEAGGYPYVAFRLWTGRDNNSALITMCKILKSKGVVWDEIKDLK